MVVGHHPWFGRVFDPGTMPSGSERDLEVVSQLPHARAQFTRAQLDATRRAFLRRQAAIAAASDAASVDEAGRAIARDYAGLFFRQIERGDAFYRPVVARRGTMAYADAWRRTPLCGAEAIPIGSPVTVVETSGAMSRVRVMDVEWHWAPPRACDALTRGPVWMERDAISRDFPG